VLLCSSAYFAPVPILESLNGATGAVEVNQAGVKKNLRTFGTPHDFHRPSAYNVADCCQLLSAFAAAQKSKEIEKRNNELGATKQFNRTRYVKLYT